MKQLTIEDKIGNYVKEQIMTGVYKDDDKLSERLFCEQFKVSRAVVRSALMSLKDNGWLYVRTKSGTYVAPADLKQIEENYRARMALEPSVLLMAFPNLRKSDLHQMHSNCEDMHNAKTTAEYALAENQQHRILCARAKNRYVTSFIEPMMDIMCRVGSKVGDKPERRAICVREWNSIISELEKGNAMEASVQFGIHIRASYEAFREGIASKEESTL